ncbi:MAG: hypothetical protein GY822_21605 [Deltaproteobacteria bacterium]|nr:hypothetical protein [Deltaproteobacteria bacterium]
MRTSCLDLAPVVERSFLLVKSQYFENFLELGPPTRHPAQVDPFFTRLFRFSVGWPTVFVALLLATGCQHTVKVSSSKKGDLYVNDEPPQRVGKETVNVKVPLGTEPVRLAFKPLKSDAPTVMTHVERDHIDLWMVFGAVGSVFCLAPGCLVTSVLVANPLALGAVALLVMVGLGPCVSVVSAPSWVTLPCAGGGLFAAASPLATLLIGASPQKNIRLEVGGWDPILEPAMPSLPAAASVEGSPGSKTKDVKHFALSSFESRKRGVTTLTRMAF